MYHDTRNNHSVHHTLLPNMHHEKKGRLSPDMFHDNRGKVPAYHILPSNMYHDTRNSHSVLHMLPSNMYHDNSGRLFSGYLPDICDSTVPCLSVNGFPDSFSLIGFKPSCSNIAAKLC